MSRIDLVRLRKRAGISQRQLADMLQVRPSFLSAIENGRSRIPDEKLERIKEIFELDNFDGYIVESAPSAGGGDYTHTHAADQSDSFTHLLTHFHELAHKNSHSVADDDSADRIDFLSRRNDRLSERIDDLRDEVDSLRAENLRLKELLVRNGIDY